VGIRAPNRRVQTFLDTHRPETPCLVVDLAVVARRDHRPAAALPGVDLYDAVKANPAQPALRLLAELGCWFDMDRAAERGSTAGLCFHVGSRQRDLGAWDTALAVVAEVAAVLDDGGPDGRVPLAAHYLSGHPDEAPLGRARAASAR
jgi:diaminopimelate decarboxylase